MNSKIQKLDWDQKGPKNPENDEQNHMFRRSFKAWNFWYVRFLTVSYWEDAKKRVLQAFLIGFWDSFTKKG